MSEDTLMEERKKGKERQKFNLVNLKDNVSV